MRIRYGLLVGGVLLLAACEEGPADPDIPFPAAASAGRSSYALTDTIEVTLFNLSEDSLYTTGCASGYAAMVAHRRTNDGWERYNSVGCAGPTFLPIGLAGGAHLTWAIEPGFLGDPGTYRIGFPVSDDPNEVFSGGVVYTRTVTVE